MRPNHIEHSEAAPRPSLQLIRTYRLHRNDDADLQFDGWILADVSSRANQAQDRWTEIRIYRTTHQLYITEVVGCSVREGEIDRRTVTVHAEADTIRCALLHPSQGSGSQYMTNLAMDALVEASHADQAVLALVNE